MYIHYFNFLIIFKIIVLFDLGIYFRDNIEDRVKILKQDQFRF